MSSGFYSVIRCIPDAVRGETFNIGVVVMSRGDFVVNIDSRAARRAAKGNQQLAIDALDNLEPMIHAQLADLEPINKTKFQRMRKNHRGVPFIYADPYFVNVSRTGIDPLTDVSETLMDRLIRTVNLSDQEDPRVDPVGDFRQRILPLIESGRVRREKPVYGKITGRERHVHFCAEGNAQIALDILRLDFKDDEAAMRHIGEQAFKIQDILTDDKIHEFYVLPFTGTNVAQGRLAEDPVNRAISFAKGKVVRGIDEAEQIIRAAAG